MESWKLTPTSVGFAAPINQLRALAASVNMPFPVAAAAQELAATEVARRVTPAVANIRVWGNSGGHLYRCHPDSHKTFADRGGGCEAG